MPCRTDDMMPTRRDCEVSKLVALLNELDGKGSPDPKTYGDGENVLGVCVRGWTQARVNKFAGELCERCQELEIASEYGQRMVDHSLELQMWWRDHKEADRARVEFEYYREKTEEEKKTALSKLTDYERNLLGLD